MLGRLKQGGVSIACGAISNYNAQEPTVLKSMCIFDSSLNREQITNPLILACRLFSSDHDAPIDPRLHCAGLRATFRRSHRHLHQGVAGRQTQDLGPERAGRADEIRGYPGYLVEAVRWWEYRETCHEVDLNLGSEEGGERERQ